MHEKYNDQTVALNGGTICPHCGFDERNYQIAPYVLPPFTVLNVKYFIGKMLGAGGFGITYIAMDMALERIVAIKEYFVQGSMYRSNTQSINVTVSNNSLSQEKIYSINREKFEAEAKTLAKLEHLPGIVRVYDYFNENGTSYMALEFLSGVTLQKYVKQKGGRLQIEEVLEKLEPVMRSLELLHENKILHRDISPDNIMVSEEGKLTLFDFGGAKLDNGGNASICMLAKSGYSPIEQMQTAGNQGPWTDVYAMAATIYYCLSGVTPIDAIQRVSDPKALKAPKDLGISIPSKIEAALMKGMQVQMSDRYKTMQEFYTALRYVPKQKKSAKGLIVAGVAVLLIGGGVVASQILINNKEIPVVVQDVEVEKGIYLIESYSKEGFALTIPENIYQAGIKVALDTVGDSNIQKFWIRKDTDSFLISTVCSDKALAAKDNEETQNVDVIQDNIQETEGQHWYFEDAGDDTFYIRSDKGMYLSLDDLNIVMTKERDEENGRWFLTTTERNHQDSLAPIRGDEVAMEETYYNIIPYSEPEKRLNYINENCEWNIVDEADSNSLEITLADNNQYIIYDAIENYILDIEDTDYFQWKFIFAGSGTYSIQNEENEALTYDETTGRLSVVSVGDELEASQRWKLQKTELSDTEEIYRQINHNGYIVNQENEELALSVRNDSKQSGANLQVVEVGSCESQFFEVTNISDDLFELYDKNSFYNVAYIETIDNSARILNASEENSRYWSIELADDGYFYIKNSTGKYLCTNLSETSNVCVMAKDSLGYSYKWKIY